jgi:hypothetical protein
MFFMDKARLFAILYLRKNGFFCCDVYVIGSDLPGLGHLLAVIRFL